MTSEHRIVIAEIIDNVVWMQFEHDGRPVFKVPLAQCIRDYLEPACKKDIAKGDGFSTEQAFKKLVISEAFESEIIRA